MDPAEIPATLDGCFLCHRQPIVGADYFIPVNDQMLRGRPALARGAIARALDAHISLRALSQTRAELRAVYGASRATNSLRGSRFCDATPAA